MRRALIAVAATLVSCSDESPPPTAGPYDCGPPAAYMLELTTAFHEVCVGDEQTLTATAYRSCGGGTSAANGPSFASSDSLVIKIEGARAIATGPGAAELTARAEGLVSEPRLIKVLRCSKSGS